MARTAADAINHLPGQRLLNVMAVDVWRIVQEPVRGKIGLTVIVSPVV